MLLIGVDPRGRGAGPHLRAAERALPGSATTRPACWSTPPGPRANGLGVGDELWLNSAPARAVRTTSSACWATRASARWAPASVVVLDSDFLSEAFDVPAPVRYVDLKVAEGAEDEVLAALDRTMTEPFVVETVADARAAARPRPGRVRRARLPVRAGGAGRRRVPGGQHAGHDPGRADARGRAAAGGGHDLAAGDGPLPAPGAGARPAGRRWSACCWAWRWRPS